MKIASVIQFEGDNDTLVWKFPEEDFNSSSELIVHESQEAIFMKNGKICDVFTAGRYKLTTENLPILRRLISIPFGGNNPFHCEVYFVNKAFAMDIFWGTKRPMEYEDVKYNVILPIGASGQMAVQIDNSVLFLNLLVGTTNSFTKSNLIEYFRAIVSSCLKDNLAKIMEQKQVSVFKINSSLEDITKNIESVLQNKLKTYGLTLVNFAIDHIHIPEDDPSFVKLKNALAKRGEMDILGYTYQQERSFDVLNDAVKNEGSQQTGLMNAGVGLGLGFGVGGAVSDVARNTLNNFTNHITQPVNTQTPTFQEQPISQEQQSTTPQPKRIIPPPPSPRKCPTCGIIVKQGAYCLNCGTYLLQKKVCSNCGKEIPAMSKFCPICGNKIGE